MRTFKTFLNLASSVFNSAVSLCLGLWATPYILKWLGQASFGAFRALTDLTGYFALLEFGFFGVLLMKLAEYSRPGKKEHAHRLFSYSIRYYIKLSLFALVAAGALYPLLGKVIPVEPALRHDLQIAYFLSCLTLVFFPFQSFKAFNEATQRSFVNNRGILFQMISTILFSLILARQGYGIRGQALAFVLGLFISNIYTAYKAQAPKLILPGRPVEPLEGFQKLQWSSFINDLCGRAAILSDNLIVSIVMGPASVPTFHLTQRLINVTQNQLQNISQASWSSLSDLYHENQMDRFRQRIYDLTKFVAIASASVLISLALFNERLVTIWVGSQFFGGLTLTLLTVINSFILAVLSVWGWCFLGVGKNFLLTPMMIVQACINVTLSFIGTHNLGILGPTLGTTVTYLVVPCLWIPILLRKYFQISIGTLLLKVVDPAILGALVFLPLFTIRHVYFSWHWYECLLAGAFIAILYLALSYLVLLDSAERKLYRDRVVILWRQIGGLT